MKIVLRIFFVLLFCYMGFSALNASNRMIEEDAALFSATANKLFFSKMKDSLAQILVIREKKEEYLQRQGTKKEVDQKIKELNLIVKSRLPENYQVKASLGIFLTRAFGLIIGAFYLLVVVGLIFNRFKNLSFFWLAACFHFTQFVVLFMGIIIGPLISSEIYGLKIFNLLQLLGEVPQGATPPPSLLLGVVASTVVGYWKFLLLFLIYMVICIFYFKSSFYQEKESVA